MKPYRFSSDRYHLVVFATSLRKARDYVKGQSMSSLTHRALKYIGEGHPTDTKNWIAAKAN